MLILVLGVHVFFALLLTSCKKDDSTEPEIIFNLENFATTIAENPSTGQLLGSISASTSEGTLSYTSTSQTPDGAIIIDASTYAPIQVLVYTILVQVRTN